MGIDIDGHAYRPAEQSAPHKRFGWKTVVLLVTASSLLGLMLVESLVRLSGLDIPRVWEPDPALGWHHIPLAERHFTEEGDGWIKINSLGYRDRERSVTKEDGVFRILALGDSMTEADQVNLEQTYCHLLEQQLNRGGQPVEVLNFGCNGYSPLQELLLLRQEGNRYRPDLVMVGLFLDNDVAGCHPDLSTVPESPFAEPSADGLKFDFSRCEQSYQDYRRQPIYAIRKWSATYRVLRSSGQRRAGVAKAKIPTRFMLYAEPCPPVWEDAWLLLERTLVELQKETERQGIELLIVSLPCAQAVSPRSWGNVQQQVPAMSVQSWDLERPERRLAGFADKHGLLLLQLLPMFQAETVNEPLFFGDIGHMTAVGHALTARLIYEFIAQQNLLANADRQSATRGISSGRRAMRE